MEYVIQTGKLDNTVHEISYDQLKILYEDNIKETRESREITASSYRGENYYTEGGNLNFELGKEYLLRDPKTAGMRVYYPHGIVIEQAQRRNYYRGENQIYAESVPSLLRALKKYETVQERELYRLVSDMRIAEFSFFLQKFNHVKEWKISDILYEPLAQHYGLQTSWLDITDDFNVALFFATCFWDWTDKSWKPLTKEQTEIDENHRYGMIFHMPSYQMPTRYLSALNKFSIFTDQPIAKNEHGEDIYGRLEYPIYRGDIENITYPLGFQPFMRCHMQSGYGIYMRTPKPLQKDYQFEKLKFRHSEELSKRVFDLMKGGELIYPHEGLKQAQFIIDDIARATSFSEEAFNYALYRSHYFRVKESEEVRELIQDFIVDGKKIEIGSKRPWKLSKLRRERIDAIYQNFSVEDWYGIKILDRQCYPGPNPMFEPWMIPEVNDGLGVEDFKVRDKVECGMSIASRNLFSLLDILMQAKLTDF